MLVLADKERCGDWAKERIPGVKSWGEQYEAIGWEKDGQLTAVVVYTNWSGPDISMHIAAIPGRRWMSRVFLRAVFAFPFLGLGVRRVTWYVPSANTESVRFSLHLGAKLEGVKRDGWYGDDMLILGMIKSECRYI